MKGVFLAAISKDDGKWHARVPDLPGCVTTGRSLEEAVSNIRDALHGCICVLEDEGKAIPAPSPAIETKDGELGFVIETDSDQYRRMTDTTPVRVNVSIPAWMNTAAKKRHISCSKVLQKELEKILG